MPEEIQNNLNNLFKDLIDPGLKFLHKPIKKALKDYKKVLIKKEYYEACAKLKEIEDKFCIELNVEV